jgi:hypothetical protein
MSWLHATLRRRSVALGGGATIKSGDYRAGAVVNIGMSAGFAALSTG